MQWENVSDEQLINEVRKRGYIIKDAAITMTRDDIIRMAQECQLIGMRPHLDGIYEEALQRFAALVAAAEREACAEILLDYTGRDDLSDSDQSLLKHLFELIRARNVKMNSE